MKASAINCTNNDRLWTPSKSLKKQSAMERFKTAVNRKFSLTLFSYDELHHWSCVNKSEFWPFLAEFLNIPLDGYQQVVDEHDGMFGAQWFPGATVNYAEQLLKWRGDETALIYRGEDGLRLELSRSQLRQQVASVSYVLHKLGVQKGDCVAGFISNRTEAVVMMLACASMGVIWSSCSPDFGSQAALDRLGQVKPRVLLAVEGYQYDGKLIDCRARIKHLKRAIHSIEQIVLVPFPAITGPADEHHLNDVVSWNEILHYHKELRFTPLAFDHPLCVLFSSGTTGAPKGIVHGHGGTLLQHAKELMLHTNLKEQERIFYFTTCSWMMWNWLVSGLFAGAAVVLYDGSPFYQGPEQLWQLAEQEQINVFGTSARYLTELEKTGYVPREHHELDSLNTLLSTGSPLAPERFDFVYRAINGNVMLSSISGGTDIISCFALGCPLKAVYRGELQCAGLGMDIQFINDEGKPALNEPGELICRQSFPSRPVGFWNDADDALYQKAYYQQGTHVWRHGDYGELTDNSGVIIHGRFDATLNPGGVRIGTAEIYRQLAGIIQINESLAVGQRVDSDERIILFIKLHNGEQFTGDLERHIRKILRDQASPRHVPAIILAVADLPRTVNGKLSELAVRSVIHGQPVKNRDVLANPESLKLFRNLAALKI